MSCQRQLATLLYETLCSPSTPKPNPVNIILNSIWDFIEPVYQDINELKPSEKTATLDYLNKNLKLPPTHHSFNQLNQQLNSKKPPFLTFKFNSNQFLTPKASCLKELCSLLKIFWLGTFYRMNNTLLIAIAYIE